MDLLMLALEDVKSKSDAHFPFSLVLHSIT